MTPKSQREWIAKIDAGVHAAVADALEAHRKAGREVAIWKDGRVVRTTVEAALAAGEGSRTKRP